MLICKKCGYFVYEEFQLREFYFIKKSMGNIRDFYLELLINTTCLFDYFKYYSKSKLS